MKLGSFKSEIKKLDQEFLQSILDGSALLMEKDEALNLGSSNDAFVIFWIEDENFSSAKSRQKPPIQIKLIGAKGR